MVISTKTAIPAKAAIPTAANIKYIPIAIIKGKTMTPLKAWPKK